MAEFNIRSDSVDVEQIMKQIRTRIREKRGADYTEEQIQELATVRLEKFLDPKNLRSDLLEQFRKSRPPLPESLAKLERPKEPPQAEAPFMFDDQTLFHSHRGLLRFVRRLLRPVLKLFLNPNTLNQILHAQAQFNLDMLKRDLRRRVEFEQGLYDVRLVQQQVERSRAEWNLLYYEVLHNLVLETTRNLIEVKNMRMRLESLASRLDFSERRVRALEGVVQYRPEAVRRPERIDDRDRRPDAAGGEGTVPAEAVPGDAASPAPASGEGARRRRRRRRGRRGTGLPPGAPAPPGGSPSEGPEDVGLDDEEFEAGDELSRDDETAEASEGTETPESGGGPDDDPSTSSGPSRDPSRDDQQ